MPHKKKFRESILTYLFFREARLSISPIETGDEGEYKCEITFLGGLLHFNLEKDDYVQ